MTGTAPVTTTNSVASSPSPNRSAITAAARFDSGWLVKSVSVVSASPRNSDDTKPAVTRATTQMVTVRHG